MKVFVFSTHPLWASHYETELEIIEKHLKVNDEIFHFTCYGVLKSCDVNLKHDFGTCFRCSDVTNCGRKLLSREVSNFPIIKLDQQKKAEILAFVENQKYTSLKELQDIYYKNFDIGYAVSSSLISIYRDSKPDLSVYSEELFNLMVSSIEVYESLIDYINKFHPDRVYAFNGRFAHVKAILRACQKANVDCYMHDRGADMSKYHLWKNTIPHDRAYTINMIENHWNAGDVKSRESIGSDFYRERVMGKNQGWYSFTKNQVKRLPENWNPAKRNVIIFNSAEDEFAAVGTEWQNPIYHDQLTGIKAILTDLENENDLWIYLRIHPNLKDVKDEDTMALYDLKFVNLTIIEPESSISSYELLFNADKVITFGSTMGIEAVYWGIPSISIGVTLYSDFNATYQPSNHEEVIEMIKSKLDPSMQEPALKYGYFYKTFGVDYQLYKPTDILSGYFRSVDIQKKMSVLRRIYSKLWNLPVVKKFIDRFERLFQRKKWTVLLLKNR